MRIKGEKQTGVSVSFCPVRITQTKSPYFNVKLFTSDISLSYLPVGQLTSHVHITASAV